MADLRSIIDDTYDNDSVLTYCTCDNYNVTAIQCGRKAVSDTTADFVEPRTHVSLVVPVQSQRRRRRDLRTNIADWDYDFHLNKDKKLHPWRQYTGYRYVMYGKCIATLICRHSFAVSLQIKICMFYISFPVPTVGVARIFSGVHFFLHQESDDLF